MNVLRDATNYVTGALGLGSSGETSGALDIMVVQHEDGAMSCTPFHVRFSKVHPTNRKERVIQLRVNGRTVSLCMKLGAAGEAFFVERVHNALRRDLVTSPLSSPVHSNGDGEGGRQDWGEAAGQENWQSRQLLNYQLLSDLSSDEETFSHRESNHAHAARLLESRSHSQSPRSPPPLLAASGSSPDSPPLGPASSDGARGHSDRKRDVVVAPAAVPAGNNGVGAMKASVAPDAMSDFSVAMAAPSGAADNGAGESGSGGEDEERGRGNSEEDYDRENDEEGGDGDEEDNADDAEGYDTAGEGGVGSGGGGGSREARAGEEGSWWWSWTWGALPVRKKPKSTRRKHHHHSHHSHHARRTRSRRGMSESFSGDPTAEGSRSVRASRESSAVAAAAASASAVDAYQAFITAEGESVVAVELSPPSQPLAPSPSLLSAAMPGTPVVECVDDGRETTALGTNAVAVAATAGDGHGERSEGAARKEIGAVDAEGSDRRGNGPADAPVAAADAAAAEAVPALRVREGGVSTVTRGVSANGEQEARSAYPLGVEGGGQMNRFDGSSARDDLLGSQASLSSPSTLETVVIDSGASAPGAVAGGAVDGNVHSAATGTPSQVVDRRPDGNGAAVVEPDGVTVDIESCPPGGASGEAPKLETGDSITVAVGALAPLREDAAAAVSEKRIRPSDLGAPPGSSDALALAHIFLSNRRDSASAQPRVRGSVFEKVDADVNGNREGDNLTLLLTQQAPLRDAAAAAARDDHAAESGGVAEEIAARCANDACACIYPGDYAESSGMKQQVVAVEAISPRAEAWLSDGPAGEAAAAGVGVVPDDPSTDSDSATRSDSGGDGDGDCDLKRGGGGEDSAHSSTRLEECPVTAPGSPGRDENAGEGLSISLGAGSGCTQQERQLKNADEKAVVADNAHGSASQENCCDCSAAAPTAGALVAGEVTAPASSARAAVAAARLPPILTSGPGFSSRASADAVVRAFGETSSRTGSLVDLRGFHTPHGGSSSDLTALFFGGGSLAPPHERALSASLAEFDSTAPKASSDRASLEAAIAARAVIGGSAADSDGNGDADAVAHRESQTTGGRDPHEGWTTASDGPNNLQAVVLGQADREALEQAEAVVAPGSEVGMAATTAQEATGETTEPLGIGDINRKGQTLEGSGEVGGRGFSREGTFAAATEDESTPTVDDPEGARGLDGGVLTAEVASAGLADTGACCIGRESGGEGPKSEPPATVTSVTSERGSDVRLAPVLSLSGHLIGPEVMRGGGSVGDGDGDGGARNGSVEGWARDTFMREAVTWDDYARYPQEILQDPRLLVAIEGRLMKLSEALPYLVAASVFGNSLLQPSCRDAPEIRSKGTAPTSTATAASAFGPDGTVGVSLSEAGGRGGRGGGGEDVDDKGMDNVSPIPENGGGGGGSGSGRSPIGVGDDAGTVSSASAAAAAAGAVALAEDEAAAGSLWGLSGWFSRRSSISPPFSPQPGSATRAAGVAIDGKNKEAFAGGGDRGNGVASARLPAVRGEEMAAQGVRGIPEAAGGGISNAPDPLTADFTERRRHDDEGYATDTDEDGDLYGKTLRPTSEQLAALRLRAGCNTVEFVVKVAGQSERVVAARVFLWGSGAKVVVSDVENTIARSGGGPEMGSFSQVVGPGVHKDVSSLFTKITRNGYKILYLTNRPLPDWHAKKGAADGAALPRGPVLCPPEVLFRSTSSNKDRRSHQEVFKMTALRGLKLIFPADVNPLYAGFGNSVSDMVAFKKMSVPEGRIFLIDPSGELHNINHTYRQTFMSLSQQVDLTFPPLPHDGTDDAFDGDDTEGMDAEEDVSAASVPAAGNVVVGKDSIAAAVAAGGAGGSSNADFESTSGGIGSSGQGDGARGLPRGEGVDSAGAGAGAGAGGAMPASAVRFPVRREKSFYPNRAAVEDQFTDLNFWRDPPLLIGDDDDDDDDDDDVGEDYDEEGYNDGAGEVEERAGGGGRGRDEDLDSQ